MTLAEGSKVRGVVVPRGAMIVPDYEWQDLDWDQFAEDWQGAAVPVFQKGWRLTFRLEPWRPVGEAIAAGGLDCRLDVGRDELDRLLGLVDKLRTGTVVEVEVRGVAETGGVILAGLVEAGAFP